MIDPTLPQLYQVHVKASPQQLWDAITLPEKSRQYFHGARIENTTERHIVLGPDGSDWGSGSVFEFDPPRRLVHSWNSRYDPDLAREPESRVTWEIEDCGNGVCLLTVTHDRLEQSPKTARNIFGPGWTYVLSSLKTFVETGSGLPALT